MYMKTIKGKVKVIQNYNNKCQFGKYTSLPLRVKYNYINDKYVSVEYCISLSATTLSLSLSLSNQQANRHLKTDDPEESVQFLLPVLLRFRYPCNILSVISWFSLITLIFCRKASNLRRNSSL